MNIFHIFIKKNLLKFAEFLKGYNREFDLYNYDLMSSLLEKCGFENKKVQHWYLFSQRTFNLDYYSNEWHWCFNWQWRDADNSVIGCAARIRILIEDGVPENYWEQMWRREPLSYNLEDLKLIKEIEKVLN